MDIKEIETIGNFGIVILGNFNPAILHPEWLDRNQVLPPHEVREIAESKRKEVKGLEGIKVKFIGSNILVSGVETRLKLPSYNIGVTPDKFEVSTSNKDKYEELPEFVAATFKILEHTPITAIGINFMSSLKFSKRAIILMHSYFCAKPDIILSVFGEQYRIDSKIRYDYNGSAVTLFLELKEESDEIGINFNYNKGFTEQEGSKEMIKYLLDNYKPMMMNADKIIKHLFRDPIDGGKESAKSGKDGEG